MKRPPSFVLLIALAAAASALIALFCLAQLMVDAPPDSDAWLYRAWIAACVAIGSGIGAYAVATETRTRTDR